MKSHLRQNSYFFKSYENKIYAWSLSPISFSLYNGKKKSPQQEGFVQLRQKLLHGMNMMQREKTIKILEQSNDLFESFIVTK